MIRDLLIGAVVIVGGYFGWQWYQGQQNSAPPTSPPPPDPSEGQAPPPLDSMPLPQPIVSAQLPPQQEAIVRLALELSGEHDPALILGMIERESQFHPNAYNAADPNGGSWGLMQMQIPTARDMGFQGPGEGLFDPATSIALGAAYLSWIKDYLSRRGHAGENAMVAAYNAGVGNVVNGYQNFPYVTVVMANRDKWRLYLMGRMA